MTDRIQEAQLHWFKHVKRMNEGHLMMNSAWQERVVEKRPQGKPGKQWMDFINVGKQVALSVALDRVI